MIEQSRLIAYAEDFVSFLLFNLGKDCQKIKRILLFGSVARGEADKQSDVDIFIDTTHDTKKIEKKVMKIVESFYDSLKFKKYWKLLGIENDIKCVVGNLDKWKKLKRSIILNGVTLFGKYFDVPEPERHLTILSWGPIKPNSKRVLFNKRLFGYKHSGKFYKGLIQKHDGEKLDNSICIPTSHFNEFLKLFRKMNIKVKFMDVYEY